MEPQDDFKSNLEEITSTLDKLKKESKGEDTFSRQKERYLLENKLRDIPLSAERI